MALCGSHLESGCLQRSGAGHALGRRPRLGEVGPGSGAGVVQHLGRRMAPVAADPRVYAGGEDRTRSSVGGKPTPPTPAQPAGGKARVMKMANYPVMVSNGQWMLDLGSLADYDLGVNTEQGLIVSYAQFGANVWDAVLFVPGQQLLDALRNAGILLPDAELSNLGEQFDVCLDGQHDAYLTRCLLGYDYRCRRCGMVRYFDVDPPQWAKENSYRNPENVGYPLRRAGGIRGQVPAGRANIVMMWLKQVNDEIRRWLLHWAGPVYVPIDDIDGCRIICADCGEVVWQGPSGSLDGVDFEVLVTDAKRQANDAWARRDS